MLYQGQPVTAEQAFPTLLRIADQQTAHVHTLGCQYQPWFHAVEADPEFPLLNWSVCPLDLCQSPYYRAVFDLDRLRRLSPLGNWPHGYAWWAVRGLMDLEARRDELRAKKGNQ